jgi:3-hydroxy-5-phosphonooxypentane-2,4-dione thiolase
MPEQDEEQDKDFRADTPADAQGFYIKGAAGYDWGMKNRLARIFRPDSGRTVMLAIDHGYFQGPTSGLERVDLNIVPISPHADALMLTRGMLRSSIPPSFRGGLVLRASGGPSILKELSDERLAVDMHDAARLGVHAVAVQVFIGGEHETQSVRNMTELVDAGYHAGMPVLVKTYYCETGFDKVVAGCPVPVVMAGGKKLPELAALTMAWRAVQDGAAGVDMGRNIFQSASPAAMIRAVGAVVHDGASAHEAHDMYQDLAAPGRPVAATSLSASR